MSVQIIQGQQFKSRWGEWYRHDKVLIDGKQLEGCIQVRRRYLGTASTGSGCGLRRSMGHCIECLTCFGTGCVIGRDVRWLAKQNGIELPKRQAAQWATV